MWLVKKTTVLFISTLKITIEVEHLFVYFGLFRVVFDNRKLGRSGEEQKFLRDFDTASQNPEFWRNIPEFLKVDETDKKYLCMCRSHVACSLVVYDEALGRKSPWHQKAREGSTCPGLFWKPGVLSRKAVDSNLSVLRCKDLKEWAKALWVCYISLILFPFGWIEMLSSLPAFMSTESQVMWFGSG